ncbi:hypothetical protein HGRIS_003043 [Hohenbuehelia grisea]|uniref:FAD/NAD(P)-binding domain-containing protein n=1 Tax=Hohenbuehelia grisea TaxID=104357 RepID=A0ABR3JMI9_9AGAR
MPNLSEEAKFNATPGKSICIIGAGAAGLASIKAVLDTPQFQAGQWNVTAFEAREDIGGVWLPALPTDEPPLTPLYDSLTTNLPHRYDCTLLIVARLIHGQILVMAFTCFPFPPSTPLYPPAATALSYLKSFTVHFNLLPFIRFKTSVLDVRRNEGSTCWRVTLCTGEVLDFDLVIVANSHHRVPVYPQTAGLAQWLASGRATHSAWYRRPIDLGGKVLVVGNGPSSWDISAEMAHHPSTRLVVRSITDGDNTFSDGVQQRGRISEYLEDGTVKFADEVIETGIDHCILATGYELSFPFLPEEILRCASPPSAPPLPQELFNSGQHVFPLAMDIWPMQSKYPPTSLAFMGLQKLNSPWPSNEAQARAILHSFAHPEALDLTQEARKLLARYEKIQTEAPDKPDHVKWTWHRCRDDEHYEYRDALHAFAKDDGCAWDPSRSVTSDWAKEAWDNKFILRTAWISVVQRGEAEEWVKDVGEKGPHEWADVLRKLAQYAQEQDGAPILSVEDETAKF